MNDPSDCGSMQGNGKKDEGGINLWKFQGLTSSGGTSFTCGAMDGTIRRRDWEDNPNPWEDMENVEENTGKGSDYSTTTGKGSDYSTATGKGDGKGNDYRYVREKRRFIRRVVL